MEQHQTGASALDTSIQLPLRLEFPQGSKRRSLAWLAITDKENVPRFRKWLCRGERYGRSPFFVDATRGTSLVGSLDPIILLHPPHGTVTLLVSRAHPEGSPRRLLENILNSGRPHGVWGTTPLLHDGLLVKGIGGPMRETPGMCHRSSFDLSVERLSSRSYRSSAAAMRTVCESALRYPLPSEMKSLIEVILAEATARGLLEETDGGIRLVEQFGCAAKHFEALSLHEAAYEMRMLASWVKSHGGSHQLELFDTEIEPPILPTPHQGLRYIRCSMLPLSFETHAAAIFQEGDRFARNDEAYDFGKIDPKYVKRWFRDVSPLSLSPLIKTKRDNETATIELCVTMLPRFLDAFDDRDAFFSRPRSSEGKWHIAPRVAGRLFKPHRRAVSVGQAARFLTAFNGTRQRTVMSLQLLTPKNRTVNLSLPIIV